MLIYLMAIAALAYCPCGGEVVVAEDGSASCARCGTTF
jgi:hypothetical protein